MGLPFNYIKSVGWKDRQEIKPTEFRCGYCARDVGSNKGYQLSTYKDGSGNQGAGGLYICPMCNCPSFLFFDGNHQYPGAIAGDDVPHVPADVDALYKEARVCIANACHTAAVLVCRKILVHLAVGLGAAEGLKFIEYVEYLSAQNYVPPNGKHWVDHIRTKGNEATHEIVLMTAGESGDLIVFVEMLLRFIYEFPAMVPKP